MTNKEMTKPGKASPENKVVCSPDEEFKELLRITQKYIHNETHLNLIEKAYKYAKEKHEGQMRRSGEPYITHPIAVAIILADLKVDIASLIAALLHDVVEDTDTSVADIEREFGPVIAGLVDGLTKIGKIKFRSNQEKLAENFRKMVLAMAKDLRVILVKLADRLHNIRTLKSLRPDKRKRIAQETLDIYSPLAARLGIYGIKSELEDLCLRETKNEIYKEISKNISAKKTEREAYIEEVKGILETELKKYHFKNAIVYGRPKHFYSIYKKMTDRKLKFEDIHDLFGFRIIVDTVKECYEALGIVHSMWKPMPGRFKDYIAMPKANMYQSLHTTVVRSNGQTAEIQIRTKEMHDICEYGVAAHWAYKEKGSGPEDSPESKSFPWLKQIVEWQSELKDPEEFMEAVKVDLFEDEIFVFTPQGDVIQLPYKATALDFAFAVHTDLGTKTVGTKVNGRITPLRSRLKSGDIVEITTSKNQHPNSNWLNFVTTSKARNKIRSYLRIEQRENSKKLGLEILQQALSDKNLDYNTLLKSGEIENIAKYAKESKFDDALIAIGYGKVNCDDIILKAFPPHQEKTPLKDQAEQIAKIEKIKKQSTAKPPSKNAVLVGGLENIMVTFARCCAPLPGEDIIGFITRGKGVTIHRADCSKALDLDPIRRINVSWANQDNNEGHICYLQVITHDRHGVLADVTAAISQAKANIKKAQINISSDLLGVLDFEINLKNLTQLNSVMDKIETVPGVVEVRRYYSDPQSKEED